METMQLETQVSPDAETQINAPDAVETPELAAPEAEQKPEAESTESTESEESKALKRMQRRIDKRTADVYRERAEKEQLAQRIAQLEANLAPKEAQQSFDPSQIEHVVRTQAQEIARIERVNEKCNEIAAKGAKEFPDFNKSLQSLALETGPLFDQRGRPEPMMQVILESENPARLLHHLGTHPEVAADLVDLTPTQLARKLDRIEREMSVQPTKSSAPKPLTPTRGASSNDELHPGLSDADWITRREKQLREARR